MKKKFTLLLFAILSLTMSLNAQSPLAFQWAHSVDGATTGGDNVMGMCKVMAIIILPQTLVRQRLKKR